MDWHLPWTRIRHRGFAEWSANDGAAPQRRLEVEMSTHPLAPKHLLLTLLLVVSALTGLSSKNYQ